MVTEVQGGRVETTMHGVAPCEQSTTLAHGNTVAKKAEPGMATHHAELPIELPGLHKGCGSPALPPALSLTFHGFSHLNQTPGKIYS